MSVPTPSVEYAQLSPMLIVFAAGLTGVLLEALLPRHARLRAQLTVSCGALLTALLAVALLAGRHGSTVMGSVMVDGPTLYLQGAILVTGLAALAPLSQRSLVAFTPQASSIPGSTDERAAERAGAAQTEVFPLLLLAIGAMMLLPAASDLLTMFVALEVLSLPLYVLCGVARGRRLLSQEAALKYFLLGAFSSAIFLYGIALVYGFSGTLALSGIADAVDGAGRPSTMALVGVGLLLAGLLFKIGAVPFHWWVPDVYQGAPTPITGFMAAATKIAAIGAMLRIVYVALPGLVSQWRPILWTVAAVTMTVAAVLTVTQTDVKRLLGYSAVANVGFLLLGVSATATGLPAVLFYLVAYGISTIGAFAVVTMIRSAGDEEEPDTARWTGLGRRAPVPAAALALFLLALAGIPLTSGFIGKFAIFQSAAADGATTLVIVGVLTSAVAVFAYTRVIMTLFFTEPVEHTPQVRTARSTMAVVAAAASATVLLGIMPQPLLDLAGHAGQFLR